MKAENRQPEQTGFTEQQKREIKSIRSFVETAVGEMAYEAQQPYSGFEDLHDRIQAKRKRGVHDPAGAVADELFNEASTVADLSGDRLFDLVHGTWGTSYADNATWNAAVEVLGDSMPHVKTKLIQILARA